MSSQFVVLGAEKQAATSLALSRPDCLFEFITDSPVVDGWDLPNVAIRWASPGEQVINKGTHQNIIILCGRWLSSLRDGYPTRVEPKLLSVIPVLRDVLGDCVLQVQGNVPQKGRWIVKGDRWHRPDAPTQWSAEDSVTNNDPYGCGVVFQSAVGCKRTYLVGGRRDRDYVGIGALEVLSESFGREAFLLAAESVEQPSLIELSVAALAAVDLRGMFTINWVEDGRGRFHLSSLRPWPRAWFQLFLRGGIDLLACGSGVTVLEPGLRIVMEHSYTPYWEIS